MPTPTDTKDAVTTLVDAGRSLDEIETDVIARAHLNEEERAALWLYAWSRRRRMDRAVRSRRFPGDLHGDRRT